MLSGKGATCLSMRASPGRPSGVRLTQGCGLVLSQPIRLDPRVGFVARQDRITVSVSDVAADGVAVVAVDPPFSLLEVDGVGGDVPVEDK